MFASLLGDYYAQRGRALDDPSVISTIRTNSTLVPRRAETLVELLRQLLGIESLKGRTMLEAGSGFGALAAYFAMRGADRVVGIDTNGEYVRLGQEGADELGLRDRLTAEQADMSSMPQFPDESFEVVIANNSFIYLPTLQKQVAALREFRRVLTPDGALLIYQANRWRLREPFTGDPIVHVLPSSPARALAKVTGWHHNHGRIRLISPGELRRELRGAGLQPAGTVGFGRGSRRHTRPLVRNFGGWYAQAGRRPGA